MDKSTLQDLAHAEQTARCWAMRAVFNPDLEISSSALDAWDAARFRLDLAILNAPPLSDADLIKAYQESGGEAGDPRADELAAEISRRNLDL